jgi:hypothetical protein
LSTPQPHPWLPVLATSGIEDTITLWGVGGQRSSDPLARTRLARSDAYDMHNIAAGSQEFSAREREQYSGVSQRWLLQCRVCTCEQ